MTKQEFFNLLTDTQKQYLQFLLDESYQNGYDAGNLTNYYEYNKTDFPICTRL